MDITGSVLRVLDNELNLQGKALSFSEATRLRGNLPQLDSIAIVSVISALETRLGFVFPEDELDGAVFDSVGSLVRCVGRLMSADDGPAAAATGTSDRLAH